MVKIIITHYVYSCIDYINVAVKRVLTAKVCVEDKHKFDLALKYCNSRFSDYQTEERRKVCYRLCMYGFNNSIYQKCLGNHPFQKCCCVPTKPVESMIIGSMSGEKMENVDIY